MDTGRLHLGPQPGGRTFGCTRARRRSGQGTFVGWENLMEGCFSFVVARLLAFLQAAGGRDLRKETAQGEVVEKEGGKV